jgi:hypothetical protein
MLTCDAVSIGCRAVPRLTGRMRTLAVFERAMLLAHDRHVLTLGSPTICRGPLNVLVSEACWPAVASVVDDWSCDRQALRASGLVIRLDQADVWKPPPWPSAADPPRLARALALLQDASRAALPESLVHSAVGASARGPWPWQAAADDALAGLRRWLREGGTPPLGLVGLGPGSTPAGDDLLAGVLATLAALGDDARCGALGAAVRSCVAHRTTPLSAALLDAAADGLVGEDLTAAIAALVSADLSCLPRTIALAVRHGATSGWDAIGGAALTLAASIGVGSSEY